MVTNATANPATKNRGNGQKKPQGMHPFVRAATERTEFMSETNTQMTGNQIQIAPLNAPPLGFLRGLIFRITATGGDHSTAAAAFNADGPFNVLQQVTLTDVNGNPIQVPLSGFEMYLREKYLGHTHISDAKLRDSYDVSGEGEGNFEFTLRLPVEISARDALGSLANQSAQQTYKLQYAIAPSTTVFDTVPDNTLPSIEVEVWAEMWTPPADIGPFGIPNMKRPPAHGTTQYTVKLTENVGAGDQIYSVRRVGNLIRGLIFVARTGGARSENLFPTQIRWERNGDLLEALPTQWLRDRMVERTGLKDGALDAAGGLDTGVYVLDYAHDLDGRIGYEMRDGYLPTSRDTRLELRGTFQAATDLEVILNDVAVPAGQSVWDLR